MLTYTSKQIYWTISERLVTSLQVQTQTYRGGCLQRIDKEQFLAHLPVKLVRRIRGLAGRLNRTPLQIVEEGIALLERYANDEGIELTDDDGKLAKVAPDPFERRIYLRIAKSLRQLWASEMPEEKRKARAGTGAAARMQKTTAKQRSEIARLGAAARAKKIAERKAKEQQPPD